MLSKDKSNRLFDLIPQANVVCVVYDVTEEESLERVCIDDG